MWIAKVIVSYKTGILDPEAKTIHNALISFPEGILSEGYQYISKIETGKYFQISFDDSVNREKAEELTKQACDKLLTNPVIQKYKFQLEEVSK
ncbi:MAG: phosphoribosylformylglycinamidine synthase, purS protein [Candidatus Neomarinimicrobiota bacterium]|nr:MAG: phosphoribosylformylglycinamidine synthase, purS protein [Candidatus Neomarinimicrobiota bacterium]